jgi:hypothetical protein
MSSDSSPSEPQRPLERHVRRSSLRVARIAHAAMTSLKTGAGLDAVIDFIERQRPLIAV